MASGVILDRTHITSKLSDPKLIWWWSGSEQNMYLFIQVESQSQCRPVTTPTTLPPLSLQQMRDRWTLNVNIISLLIMWMHWFSFCQQCQQWFVSFAISFPNRKKNCSFYPHYEENRKVGEMLTLRRPEKLVPINGKVAWCNFIRGFFEFLNFSFCQFPFIFSSLPLFSCVSPFSLKMPQFKGNILVI